MKRALVTSTTAVAIALAIIPKFEGRSLVAYLDPVRIPTICEGYTKGVKLGDRATEDQCNKYTLESIIEADAIFQVFVPQTVRDNISPQAHAAFLSFIYNVGPGKKGVKDGFVYLKSGRYSTMLTKLRMGDIEGACKQLPLWTTAGGKELRGLVIRRAEEMRLCLSGLN